MSHQRKNNIGSYVKPIRHTIPFFLSLSLVLPNTGAFRQNYRLILLKHQININTERLRIRTNHSRMHWWENLFVFVCVCVYIPSQPGGSLVDSKPMKHTHRNEPSVFKHSPFGMHSASSSHSSTSMRMKGWNQWQCKTFFMVYGILLSIFIKVVHKIVWIIQ